MSEYLGNEQNISLPDNYKGEKYDIYKFAFAFCKFENIVFSNGVTGIGTEVFHGCENLKTITIPETVTKIDDFFLIEGPDKVIIYTTKNSPIHQYSRTEQGKIFNIKIKFIR